MVETLFAAEAEFGVDLVVCYADIAYEPKMIEALLRSPHNITVAVNTQWRALWEMRFENPLDDAESLVLGPDGTIQEIGNKVSDIESIEGQFTGLLRFRGAGVDHLRNARTAMEHAERPWKNVRPVEKAYMMELILSGRPVHAALVDGGWLEIDTVEDFEKTSRLFDDGTIRQFFDCDPVQPPGRV
jgi:choline kinase